MGVGSLITELGSSIVSFLQTVLPGVMTAVVDTFDVLAFTGTGENAGMTAVFGWIIMGSVLSLSIWLLKKVSNKAFGGGKV